MCIRDRASRLVIAAPSKRGFDALLGDADDDDGSGDDDVKATPIHEDEVDDALDDSIGVVRSIDPTGPDLGPSDLVRQLTLGGGDGGLADAGKHRRKVARATLIAKFEEVIDNMYGTAEEDFLDDLAAVMNLSLIHI